MIGLFSFVMMALMAPRIGASIGAMSQFASLWVSDKTNQLL
jgi:hypothetical protein